MKNKVVKSKQYKGADGNQQSKRIPYYKSISQFLKAIGRTNQQESDFTIDTLENYFKGKLIHSGVYRANYFVLVYITQGSGTLMLDNEVYNIGPSTFYYVNPGHLRALNVNRPLKGYMLSTNEGFIRTYYKGDIYKDFPFLRHDNDPPGRIAPHYAECFKIFLSGILKVYNCEDGKYQYDIINNLTIALLYKIKELLLTSSSPSYKKYSSSPLVFQFMKLLHDEVDSLIEGKIVKKFTVKEFANMLHITSNHLNKVVKKETGKSVSAWINARVLLEAQTLLLSTNRSITQISEQLGFNEVSYFIKYFKKKTGHTPKEYRVQSNF
jgi:AraC family transcriptional regulator, transcriptional activator of pobA